MGCSHFCCAAAVEQPHHQLHKFVPQSGDGVSADAAGSDPDHFPLKFIESTMAGVMGVVFLIAPFLARLVVAAECHGIVYPVTLVASSRCLSCCRACWAQVWRFGSGGFWTGAVFKSA